jgi:hypothetical protein
MERKQIDELIEKYRRMGTQELKYGEEKCAFFDRIADQIEISINEYLDDDFQTDDDILKDVNTQFEMDGGVYDIDD